MLSDSSKGEFFKETRKKILSLHGGKIEFEFYVKDFLVGFLEKFAFKK